MQAVHWKSGHKRRCLPLEASESSNNWTVGEMQEGKGNRCDVHKSILIYMILEKKGQECCIFKMSLHVKFMEILILNQLQARVCGLSMRLQLLMNVRIRSSMITDN